MPADPIQPAKIRQNQSRPDPTRGSIRPVDNSVLTTIFRVLYLKAHAHVIYMEHQSYICRKYPATL